MLTYHYRENTNWPQQTETQMDAEQAACDRCNRAQKEAGKVAVYWQGGWLHLSYKGRVETYRGSAVEGCHADDEFVQQLAQELKDKVEGQLAVLAG